MPTTNPRRLSNGVRWLDAHPDVGALAPLARDGDGNRVYLCKRYPAIFDLFLRAFAPKLLRRMFRRRLDRYELRDIMDRSPPELLASMTGAMFMVQAVMSGSAPVIGGLLAVRCCDTSQGSAVGPGRGALDCPHRDPAAGRFKSNSAKGMGTT